MADICRSCGAPVVFMPSATSGKPMILDRLPEKRIVLEAVEISGQVISGGAPAMRMVARVKDTFTDHHGSCPKSGEWRGRRRGGGAP